MKITSFVVVLLTLGFAASAAAQTLHQESDLVKGRAGFMVIGESIYDGGSPADEMKFEKKQPRKEDPYLIEIYRANKPFMKLETRVVNAPSIDFIVESITVFDSKFRTEEGVGVGSTLAVVRAKYPDARVDKTSSGRWAATVGDLSMNFWLGEKPTEGPPGDEWVVTSITVGK